MQACKLIMFYYACTHVRSRVWSGSAAKGVLRKRAQIGAPVRKGTRADDSCDNPNKADITLNLYKFPVLLHAKNG